MASFLVSVYNAKHFNNTMIQPSEIEVDCSQSLEIEANSVFPTVIIGDMDDSGRINSWAARGEGKGPRRKDVTS